MGIIGCILGLYRNNWTIKSKLLFKVQGSGLGGIGIITN